MKACYHLTTQELIAELATGSKRLVGVGHVDQSDCESACGGSGSGASGASGGGSGTSGGFGTAPTVTPNSGDLCASYSALFIGGTNFIEPNTVELRDSANVLVPNIITFEGPVGIVLFLTDPPILNLGALTAVVTNAFGSSGDPVQVATVVLC